MENKINATWQTWAHVAAHLGCNTGTITDAGYRLGETPTLDELRVFLSGRSRPFGRWDAAKADAAKRMLETLYQPGENRAAVQTPSSEIEPEFKRNLAELQAAQAKLRDFGQRFEAIQTEKQTTEARLKTVQTELTLLQKHASELESQLTEVQTAAKKTRWRFSELDLLNVVAVAVFFWSSHNLFGWFGLLFALPGVLVTVNLLRRMQGDLTRSAAEVLVFGCVGVDLVAAVLNYLHFRTLLLGRDLPGGWFWVALGATIFLLVMSVVGFVARYNQKYDN